MEMRNAQSFSLPLTLPFLSFTLKAIFFNIPALFLIYIALLTFCNTIFIFSLAMFWCQTLLERDQLRERSDVAGSILSLGNLFCTFFYGKAKYVGTLLVNYAQDHKAVKGHC
uniref:Uncharacterized protein n=1 Tax=Cacopsylla melanoneura TaxID=428564 RepID=A0A8D9BQW0_9HEMI